MFNVFSMRQDATRTLSEVVEGTLKRGKFVAM